MTRDDHPESARRRAFLHTLAGAGAAGAALALGGGAVPAGSAPQPAPGEAQAARGYRETPHVRTYYDKARF